MKTSKVKVTGKTTTNNKVAKKKVTKAIKPAKKLPSSIPTNKELKGAKKFVQNFSKRLGKKSKQLNEFLKPTLSFFKRIKLTSLSWENPKTGHIVGYQRAHNLGLDIHPDAPVGILNPKTKRLVSIFRAKSLGLLSDSMFKQRVAA